MLSPRVACAAAAFVAACAARPLVKQRAPSYAACSPIFEAAAAASTELEVLCLLTYVPIDDDRDWWDAAQRLDAQEAAPHLARVLADRREPERTRRVALSLLEVHRLSPPRLLREVLDADPDPVLRAETARLLSRSSPNDDRVRRSLRRCIRDADPYVRERCVEGWGHVTREARELALLEPASRDPVASVRGAAISALARGDATTRAAAERACDREANVVIQHACAEALGREPPPPQAPQADVPPKPTAPPPPQAPQADVPPPAAAPAPPPSPAGSIVPMEDRLAVVTHALELALVKRKLPEIGRFRDPKRVVISSVHLPDPVPRIPGVKLVVMSPDAIAAKADRDGDFLVVELGEVTAGPLGLDVAVRSRWVIGAASRRRGKRSHGGALLISFARDAAGVWRPRIVSVVVS